MLALGKGQASPRVSAAVNSEAINKEAWRPEAELEAGQGAGPSPGWGETGRACP